MARKEASFSIGLGLFDYINPIFYSITTITIFFNLKDKIPTPLFILFLVGMILSLIFGFSIPTVKCLVGLGKMQFKMPVNLVFYVNSGILLSGIALFKYVSNINNVLFVTILVLAIIGLCFIVYKTKKFNTVAVLTGAIGYILLYSSLIPLALNKEMIIPVTMYAIAIVLFLFLCGVGIKANLKNPKVHWVIEISNVICQGLVAIATVLQFK